MRRQFNYLTSIIQICIFFLVASCNKESYRTEEINYKNGDIEISARIYKPFQDGKYPAVVIVPSAEPDTKEVYAPYAEYFASHGIVAICYDKRGSGKSTGNIWKATFEDLLNDALAGIQYLKQEPSVDPNRMGFVGHSQGGMYIFKADRISEDVAFVIDVSGSPRTPMSQSDYNIRSKIEHQGGSRAFADSLIATMDRYIAYLRTRENYELIRTGHDHLMVHPEKALADKINYFGQFKYLLPPDSLPAYEDLEMYPFMRSYDFEPGAYYPGLKIPGLVVYGGKDRVIPAMECAERVKELQPQSPNVELKVFEDANHAMKVESISGQKYADGFFEFLTVWITEHTKQ